MGTLDLILFFVAVIGVIFLGIWKSRDENTKGSGGASDYFLAGRGLTWWLVGFSLIAANISTEQFVGMSGQAADWLGMAIASYEWMAAITLVVVAFVFLPKLLRCGIYTIPEFLEYRFGWFSRTVMAVATMVILVGVPTASVIFSGAKVVSVFFQGTSVLGLDLGNIGVACWVIAISAALYVFVGGLKACAWTDLIWGSGLIVGGAVIMFFTFQALGEKPADELFETRVATSPATVQDIEDAGAYERFVLLNSGPAMEGPNGSGGKLHMVRPITDSRIPWTALVLGLWIPNFFYWGLNQYIMQRTLGSKSLADGQKGVVFAAGLKLIIPFVVVIPGILAYNLFRSDLRDEAVDRNALLIAGSAPALFDSLPDAARPDPENERKKYKLRDIERALERSRGAEPPPVVFGFDALYAELQPEVVAVVATHNLETARQAGATVFPDPPAPGAPPAELVAYNSGLVGAANGAASKESGLRSETLVAQDYDAAFPTLLKNLTRPGFTWFILAAIFGAVVSSLASMLNSASTIATMDIVAKIGKRINGREMTQPALVTSGRVCVVLFVLIAALIAPKLGSPAFGGIFTFIQEFQGFISPGVLAVFLFGFLVPRAPRYLGWLGILLNAALYGSLKAWIGPWMVANGWWFDGAAEMSFLDRMGICFLVVIALCTVLTLVNPLKQPVQMPVNERINLTPSKGAKTAGIAVVATTLVLYLIFW